MTPRQFTRLALLLLHRLGAHRHQRRSGPARRGSGLGCPDWPSCYQPPPDRPGLAAPADRVLNRLVTIVLIVVFVATVVAAYLRRPKRRDLIVLSAGCSSSACSPTPCSAASSSTRSSTRTSSRATCGSRWPCWRLPWSSTTAPATTTPRAPAPTWPARPPAGWPGSSTGSSSWSSSSAPRPPARAPTPVGARASSWPSGCPSRSRTSCMAHSAAAVAFIGMVTATWLILEANGGPGSDPRRGEAALPGRHAPRALIGFIQYATHLPAWLVELHVIGAVLADDRGDQLPARPDRPGQGVAPSARHRLPRWSPAA